MELVIESVCQKMISEDIKQERHFKERFMMMTMRLMMKVLQCYLPFLQILNTLLNHVTIIEHEELMALNFNGREPFKYKGLQGSMK